MTEPANASEIAALLTDHDFGSVATHHSGTDTRGQVTFQVPGLCGVHLPWLQHELEERGWHVEKVENTGTTSITVEEGTDPYVPT